MLVNQHVRTHLTHGFSFDILKCFLFPSVTTYLPPWETTTVSVWPPADPDPRLGPWSRRMFNIDTSSSSCKNPSLVIAQTIDVRATVSACIHDPYHNLSTITSGCWWRHSRLEWPRKPYLKHRLWRCSSLNKPRYSSSMEDSARRKCRRGLSICTAKRIRKSLDLEPQWVLSSTEEQSLRYVNKFFPILDEYHSSERPVIWTQKSVLEKDNPSPP